MRKAQDVIRVACALIIQEGKVLITRRPMNKQQGGKWEFPGGKLQENETAEGCIVREIAEELGVDVRVKDQLSHVTHNYPLVSIELIPMVCTIHSGSISLREHTDSRWATAHELETTDLSEADKKLVSQVKAILQ